MDQKKIYHDNTSQKKGGVAVLISKKMLQRKI